MKNDFMKTLADKVDWTKVAKGLTITGIVASFLGSMTSTLSDKPENKKND